MKKLCVLFLLTMTCFAATAEDSGIESALRDTYTNCIGIDDALHDMKVKAGINTAVTGVGTGLGIGATATGIAKAHVDATIEQKFNELQNLSYTAVGQENEATQEEFLAIARDLISTTEFTVANSNSSEKKNSNTKEMDLLANDINQLNTKSKKLGNWRTGLLAGNTATNIAGAAIAGTNKVKEPLEKQIENCKTSVKALRKAISQAKFNGEDVSEATQIESACSGFEYIDISKINNRATGSMASSIVGAGTGTVGTIVSAVANSDNVRNDTDKAKEKNLNAAANVLSAGSTVASATATIFNATQIKAIKEVAEVASKCTEVLK